MTHTSLSKFQIKMLGTIFALALTPALFACASDGVERSGDLAAQCGVAQCLIGDVTSRLAKLDAHATPQMQVSQFLGSDLSKAVLTSGFSACDFLPTSSCWSDVLTFRQRIYSSKEGNPVGCVDITGTENHRKTFISISLKYTLADGKWLLAGANKYVSLNDQFTLSDMMYSGCRKAAT